MWLLVFAITAGVDWGALVGWLSGHCGFYYPLLTQAPTKCFIETHMASRCHFHSGRIVHEVPVSVRRVTDKGAFEGGVGHLEALSCRDVYVSGAAENPQVGQVRDVTCYQSQWYPIGARMIRAVVQIAGAQYGEFLVTGRQACCM